VLYGFLGVDLMKHYAHLALLFRVKEPI